MRVAAGTAELRLNVGEFEAEKLEIEQR